MLTKFCIYNISATTLLRHLLNVVHNLTLSDHYHVHACVKTTLGQPCVLLWALIQLSAFAKGVVLGLAVRGIDIQGDSGGICTTLGNDSMSDSMQKSSYKHGSDF